MPLPTIADCFRVAINYSDNIRLMSATNVIHVLSPTGDEDDVFAALDASVTADMWEPCTNALQTDTVVITKLDGTPDGKVYAGAALTGDWRQPTGAQQFIPQACPLIKLATAATGRSGRGRIYLPFIAEGGQAEGIVDPTQAATCTAAWVAFANAMIASSPSCALAVASYTNSTASQVLNLFCEPKTATQRKRQRR